MPQICGVKDEAAPPGRGRRTLDNPPEADKDRRCGILGFPIG